MSYSKEMQARIDQRAAARRVAGPSFPMPRLTHNGETGEWMVREVDGDRNAEQQSVFERLGMVEKTITPKNGESYKGFVGGAWKGAVVRVAWMSQTKYRPNAIKQRVTREFTDFKNEPIELLERVFGPAGRTTSLKIYPNYQAFKEAGTLKDEDGNPAGSAYDLKAVLYVYHFERKQVIKLTVGGTARSEWFEYARNRASGDDGVISIPWTVSQPEAKLLEEVITEFSASEAKTDKGAVYFRLAFHASGLCDEAQLNEVFAAQDKIEEWVKGWEAVNARALADKAVSSTPSATQTTLPGTAADAIMAAKARAPEEEINLDDIPF